MHASDFGRSGHCGYHMINTDNSVQKYPPYINRECTYMCNPCPCHLTKDFKSLGQSLTYSVQVVSPEIQRQKFTPVQKIILCYTHHEKEEPGRTSIPRTMPELIAGLGKRKVELNVEKQQRNKTHPLLRNSSTASAHKR